LAMKNGSNEFEWIHKRKNGEEFWASVLLTRVDIGDRSFLQATVRDIDHQKKIEAELVKHQGQFQVIDDQAILAIIIIQDGLIKYANRAATLLVGTTKEDILKWPPNYFIKTVHPDDQKFVMEQYKKKEAGEKEGVIIHYAYRVVTLDKQETKWVDLYSKTIMYDGKTADFVNMIDITAKKKAEMALKDKIEELEKLNRLMVGRELKMVELKEKAKKTKK
jgi:PAS domain S-box-containing protein